MAAAVSEYVGYTTRQMTTLPVSRRSGGHNMLRLLVVLLVVGAVMAGGTALFTPWAFYMGGRFHLIPQWQGWGRLHSNSAGGDYVVYVYFYPQIRRYSGPRHVAGTAMLCTPRGEKFSLSLGGDFGKNAGHDLNGKSASFYMINRTMQHIFGGASAKPELELRGRWSNPDLVLDDHGSLSRNFDHNAALYADGKSRPYMGEISPVTLHEGDNSDFQAACAALKR
jgi:hypothetical protein